MENGTVIDLCDYSGVWASEYERNGFRVIQIDPKLPPSAVVGRRVLLGITVQHFINNIGEYIDRYGIAQVLVILMAPPCTDFTVSGAQYWNAKDRDGRTARSLEIVDSCLAVKDYFNPAVWCLENPVGRLPKLRPDTLGEPVQYINPCDFGDPYTKKTGLWGKFVPLLPLFVGQIMDVDPIRESSQGSWLMKLGGKSERTKELRSVTPQGFAKAFYEANHNF